MKAYIILLLVLIFLPLYGAMPLSVKAISPVEVSITETVPNKVPGVVFAQQEDLPIALYRIRIQTAFTALTLAFGLLHLILFFFLPDHRSNLFFSLFLFFTAAALYADFQHLMTNSTITIQLHRAISGAGLVFSLLFFYELFLPKLPRQFWIISIGALAAGTLAAIEPQVNFKYLLFMTVIHWTEVLRISILAIRRKQNGAWIIVAGFGALLLFSLYDFFLDINLLESFYGIENGYQFGLLGLFIAASIYLARNIAQTNEKILLQERRAQEREIEQQLLESEMARKTKELEEARKLERAYRALEETHQHLKTVQTQLIQSEKMASLGRLTTGIAHEIKNPLNFINNFAELNADLANELASELSTHENKEIAEVPANLREILADLKENALRIIEHGHRVDGIVKSMLEHSGTQPGQRQAVNVNKLLQEYINLAYHGIHAKEPDFNVTIERDYDDQASQIDMMPREIGRVFLNLLDNAFYATCEKARTIEGPYTPTIRVSTRQLEGKIEIRVKDNGPGIPDNVLNKVFEPFFTTKPTGMGTGLGLSLSYDIITQGHGGALSVDSSENEGTVFIITLPNEAQKTALPKN